MKIKYILIYSLLTCLSMNFIKIEAKRRTRQHARITQALQSSNASSTPFVQDNTLKIAENKIEKKPTKKKKFEKKQPDKLKNTIEDKSPVLDQPKLQYPVELQPKEAEVKEALKVLADEKEEEEEKIELQFEEADLINLIKQIEELFEVTFITDEAIQPPKSGSKAIKGNKISFKTNNPITKQEAWNLFTTFLEIASFTIVPQSDPKIYRIQTLESARKAPIPAYIGIDSEKLPDNDQVIRYVYFIQNSTLDSIMKIVDALRSNTSGAIRLEENKAFILIDKAYNIKTLMKIIKELDKVTMPQAMSVLKLRQADALQVKALYDSLTQTDDKTPIRPFTIRRQPTSLYFPENTRIIAEPRTNSLILLGTQEAIQKIEEFITKYVDIDLDQPYSPLYTYQLKYADAKTIADIMNNVTTFGANTEAGKAGGIRGEDKYLRQMSFTPELDTNRLIIKGQYDDYLVAKKIIEKLDEQQPQVAMEFLILSITLNNSKELGVQLRSKVPGLDGFLGQNVKFQTSGLRAGGPAQGIVENPDGLGVQRLLGNLLKLVTGAGPGNTIVTLGQDIFGVWGIFQILQSMTNLEVISNPFLVATNKTPSTVSVGETRRVTTSTIVGGGDNNNVNTFGDDEANLIVNVTPQINSDGMIVLKLTVEITEFTDPTDPTSAQKTTKKVTTETIVADKEVLALGGLIRNSIGSSLSKTPILGDIPVLGWLFKNKQKRQDKETLLILISTRIIKPEATSDVNKFTQNRIRDYHGTLDEMHDVSERHDPIHKLFFAADENGTEKAIDDFIFERSETTRRKNRRRNGRRRRKKLAQDSTHNTQQRNEKQESIQNKQIVNKPNLEPKDVALLPNEPLKTASNVKPTNNNPTIKNIQAKKRSKMRLSNVLKNNNAESKS